MYRRPPGPSSPATTNSRGRSSRSAITTPCAFVDRRTRRARRGSRTDSRSSSELARPAGCRSSSCLRRRASATRRRAPLRVAARRPPPVRRQPPPPPAVPPEDPDLRPPALQRAGELVQDLTGDLRRPARAGRQKRDPVEGAHVGDIARQAALAVALR